MQHVTDPAPAYSSHQLWIMTGMALLVTTLYFVMKSKQDTLEKKREKRKRVEKTEKSDEEEKTKTTITDEEERAIQANQMAAIYALMEQNDGLQTSLEGIEDQLKMYGCTEN